MRHPGGTVFASRYPVTCRRPPVIEMVWVAAVRVAVTPAPAKLSNDAISSAP